MTEDTKQETFELNNEMSDPNCGIGRLQAWLQHVALKNGHNASHLAEILGIHSATFRQLGVGLDAGETLCFARACANYLGVSTLQVLLVAGHLDALDLAPNDSASTPRSLIQVGTGCVDDVLVPKMWLPWVPPALWEAPVLVRKFVQQDIHDGGSKPFPRLAILLCEGASSIQTLREQDVAQDWYDAAVNANSSVQAFSTMVEELTCV